MSINYFDHIYIKSIGVVKLFLSNDFTEILNSYMDETGGTVHFTDIIKWHKNKKLFKSVKDSMIKHNLPYSIFYYQEDDLRKIIISKNCNDNWLSLFYQLKPSVHEKSNYFRRKVPFYYYLGYCMGYIQYIFKSLIAWLFCINKKGENI